MKSNKCEISCMSRFNSKKVSAAVVAGLLLGAPVFATVETVAPSLGFGQNVAYASVAEKHQVNAKNSSIVHFKDKKLKDEILHEMCMQNIVDASVEDITEEDALKVTSLTIDGRYIESIEGIEKFKNLTKLNFCLRGFNLPGQFLISDITPLAGLTKLTELNFANNLISDITPLKNLTNLTRLDLRANNISDLTPLKNLTKLEYLNLDNDHLISDITPLAGLTKLTELSIAWAHISDIKSLTNLTDLMSLTLYGNQISDVTPLKNLTNLKNVDLRYNNISDITPLKNLFRWFIHSTISVTSQKITLYPKSTKIDLTNAIIGNGNVKFKSDENIVDGVLTHKDGMQNPYVVSAQDGDRYSATVSVDFSQAKKESEKTSSETQAGDISEQQQLISNMTVNCDVIKKTNGKYRLIYTPKSFDGKVSVPLVPVPTEDKSQDWFPGLHNDQPSLRTKKDNVKFIEGNNNAYFTFIDSKTDKPIETQVFLKVSLYKQGKDILTDETPFKTFPEKIIFDDVDVNDKDVKGLTFVYSLSAKGYSEPLFSPTTFKHFYTEDVEQAEDLSTTLLALLKNVNNVKTSNNFKNADDNLKQTYDKAITDGQAIYDKLSSTPEQVQQATEQIKDALGKLNGAAKSGAAASQLQNRIQQLEQELNKIKQQLDESQYEHIDMFGYTQGSKERDDLFEKLRPYIVSITDAHGNKVDEIYPFSAYAQGNVLWNVKLKNLRPGSKVHFLLDPTNAQHRMDADATATVASDGTCTITLNSIVPARGMLSGYRSFPVVDCWVKIDRAAELQQLKQQLQQTKQQLEKLKQDKTLSDQQKQAEIDKLNGQITNLGKQIEKLTQENTSLKGQIATLQATVARLTEEANQCHVSDGAKAQELEKVKKQLTQAQSDLENLKRDKTLSDTQKQTEIDKLNGQITNLGKQIEQLTKDKGDLQTQLDTANGNITKLTGELEKAKQQGKADASAISNLNGQVSTLKDQLDKLKNDKTLSDTQKQTEIDKLNGQITNLGKQIEQLTKDKGDLQTQLDTANGNITKLTGELEKAKQQGKADASAISNLNGQVSTLKDQLDKLKNDKTLSDTQKQAEIDKLNGKIADLGKQIAQLTQENTSLKGQIATLQATISRLTEEANQCHVSDGAKAQELEKVKQQLTQAQSDLEKLKKDKTKSDTEKQKEIDKLSNQVTQLNQEITKLKQQDPASGSSSSAGESTGSGTSLGGDVSAPASTSALYRLYNPWTGEHLFTTDAHEVQTLTPLGWRYEGIIGQASMQEGTAVYRLYNPTTGEHHYTTNLDEVARCVANGWVKEGIAFYSQGDQAVYSMYNPYAKSFYHHYTSDENEIAQMVKDGWKKEEVKWYCTSIQPKNLIK